jgi:homogentisate 1,2-dioxygenase
MSPAPVGNADQAQFANNFFFVFGPPLLLAQGASVRLAYFHTNCLLIEL